MPDDKTILIIEDNESFRMLLSDAFADAGYKVLTADSGEDGIAQAREQTPDFILLDYTLPNQDGDEILKDIRDMDADWSKEVPVLMLTQHDDPAKVADTISRGAQGYLVKSDVEIADVVEEVSSRLNM